MNNILTAMEGTGTQKDQLDTIRPLVKSFFERISAEQWGLLTSGSPDDTTKILLAELILEIISSVTKSVVMALRTTNKPESNEKVLSSLSDSLPQSLSQALDIPDQADNVSVKGLSNLIQEEVAESVKSYVSSTLQPSQHVINQNVTPPSKLKTMVALASEMLKKMKAKFAPRQHKKRKDFLQQDHTEVATEVTDLRLPSEDVNLSPVGTGRSTARGDSPTDSLQKQASEMLQEEIRKELSDVLVPLLDEVPDSECKELLSETSLELQQFSDEVAPLVGVKGKKKKRSGKVVREKIKAFLAKCFSKVWICRTLCQLRKKHPESTRPKSRDSVRSLLDGVTSQQQMEGEKAESLTDLVSCFDNISSDKVVSFTKQLSDDIYQNLLPETVPDSLMWAQPRSKFLVSQLHSDLYGDTLTKVWLFIGLMNWWLKVQAESVSERVKVSIMEVEAEFVTKQQEAAIQREKNKACVKFFTEKIVHHVYFDLKMFPDRSEVVHSLFETTWAKVQNGTFYITDKSFKNLDKKIHKHLCKRFGAPEIVLFSMYNKDPAIEDCIVSILEQRVMTPPKGQNRIFRFFSGPKFL